MKAVVRASFDDIRLRHVRFLDAASRVGEVHVQLLSDELAAAHDGQAPKFPLAERKYFVESLRYVSSVSIVEKLIDKDTLLAPASGATWVVPQSADFAAKKSFAEKHGLSYRVITDADIEKVSLAVNLQAKSSTRKKVLLTGCYDWLHTGHVRFFEEVSEHGDVYAVVGHDANIALLKGPHHPQFPAEQRRYMVAAIKFVTQCLVSTGNGWLDAEPEVRVIKPDIYAVNEDGDKPEKRDFCAANGIQYLVLKRTPKEGLPRRESTKLRGF